MVVKCEHVGGAVLSRAGSPMRPSKPVVRPRCRMAWRRWLAVSPAALVTLGMAVMPASGQPCVNSRPLVPLLGFEDLSYEAHSVSADGQFAVGVAGGAPAGNQTIRWLLSGTIDLLPFTGSAFGVSSEGRVIVGYRSTAVGVQACRWEAGAVHPLGDLGGTSAIARGVSADGTVIVGYGADSASVNQAFRWTAADGMRPLGTLGGTTSEAYAVSDQGVVVVGYSTLPGDQVYRAFRWTHGDGMSDLGTLGGLYSQGFGVSSDGTVIVGQALNLLGRSRAFKWSEGSGMVDLGTLGGDESKAFGVSADGSVVVGMATTEAGLVRPFRWTQSTGMIDLGTLGGSVAYANAVSADGTRIVGQSVDAAGRQRAVVWRLSSLPAITTPPTAINSCRTTVATFNVAAAAPTPITYRWRKAGVPIDILANPSAATDTLRLVRVQPGDAGLYDCIVSTDCGSVTSASARLTVRTCICLEADIAGGGDTGLEPDGTIDGTDFIFFINAFAIGC